MRSPCDARCPRAKEAMRGHSVRGVKTRWTAWLCSLAVLCGCGAMPLPAPPLKTAIIDGAELHYTDEGVGETVLLLHAAGSDLRIWDEIRPLLATRYRVVAYSRRHHHPNAWPDDGRTYHFARHADDLAALLGVLGVDRVHIVAVSLGGQVAARVLVQRPELVASAIFSDALLVWPASAESKAVREAFMGRFAPLGAAVRDGAATDAAKALVDWVGNEPEGWHTLSVAKRRLYLDNAKTLLLMVHETAPPLTCGDFGTPSNPVLVLEGTRTSPAFRLTNEQLLRCLPAGAEHAFVSDAGHFWYSSHAGAAAATIVDFLSRHPISGRSLP